MRTRSRRVSVLLAGCLLLTAALAGCATTTERQPAASAPTDPTPGRDRGADVSGTSVGVGKILVVVVENHSRDQMRAEMPSLFGLAQRYGYATHYRALTHPSLGNYLAMVGGSTFGVVDDRNPASHPLHGASVFSQAMASGGTAATYAEGMPGTCALADDGRYAVRHNPWAYFVDDRAQCREHDVPAAQLAKDVRSGHLPRVGLVIPDLCHDAHDCSLAVADRWLSGTIDTVMSGPDWSSGRLAIVVTADEDDHRQDNLVLMAVLHPDLDHRVVDVPLTHLSLSRSLSEASGRPGLRAAAHAASLTEAFGLEAGP